MVIIKTQIFDILWEKYNKKICAHIEVVEFTIIDLCFFQNRINFNVVSICTLQFVSASKKALGKKTSVLICITISIMFCWFAKHLMCFSDHCEMSILYIFVLVELRDRVRLKLTLILIQSCFIDLVYEFSF